jgi:hypothetical protein
MFGPDVELCFTSYDVSAAAEAIRRSGFPDGGIMANLVENPGPASLAAELFT